MKYGTVSFGLLLILGCDSAPSRDQKVLATKSEATGAAPNTSSSDSAAEKEDAASTVGSGSEKKETAATVGPVVETKVPTPVPTLSPKPVTIVSPAREYMVKMYLSVLKRPADAEGLKYWADNYTANGWTCTNLMTAFLNSSGEVKNAINMPDASDASFLSNLYPALLWRAADAAGLQYWQGDLAAKTLSREQVVQSILSAPEFLKNCKAAGLKDM